MKDRKEALEELLYHISLWEKYDSWYTELNNALYDEIYIANKYGYTEYWSWLNRVKELSSLVLKAKRQSEKSERFDDFVKEFKLCVSETLAKISC